MIGQPRTPDTYFNFVFLTVFLLLSLIGIYHHELWSDEAHVWLISRDSSTLSQLLERARHEGHPPLWNVLLFIVARFTQNPAIMQWLHVLITAGGVAIVLFTSPFSKLQKVLFTFSYFTFYEYNIISRNYGLILLLLFAAIYFFHNLRKYPITFVLVVALLANTHALGLILAVALAIVSFNVFRSEFDFRKRALCFGVLLASMALSLIVLIPPIEDPKPSSWIADLSLSTLPRQATAFLKAFIPVPDFTQYHFWNHFLVRKLYDPVYYLLSAVFALWPLLHLRRFNAVLFFYLTATGIIVVLFVTQLQGTRYYGALFLALLAAMWVDLAADDAAGGFKVRFKKSSNRIFMALLWLQVLAGSWAWYLDVTRPFSESKPASAYIRQHKLEMMPILIDNCLGASLVAYFETPAFFLSSGTRGTFCVWDKMNYPFRATPDPELAARALQHAKEMNAEALLVTNHALQIIPSPNIRLLQGFEGSIVETENFYLYKVQP